jgi:hypothetical protein
MRAGPIEANGFQVIIPFELISFNLDYSILVPKTGTEQPENFFRSLVKVLYEVHCEGDKIGSDASKHDIYHLRSLLGSHFTLNQPLAHWNHVYS